MQPSALTLQSPTKRLLKPKGPAHAFNGTVCVICLRILVGGVKPPGFFSFSPSICCGGARLKSPRYPHCPVASLSQNLGGIYCNDHGRRYQPRTKVILSVGNLTMHEDIKNLEQA